MEVFIENVYGTTISIEVGFYDTLLDLKKKIEKSQGISASTQNLFFQGRFLLQDNLQVKDYNIVNKSRLQVFYPLPINQTEQSQVQSTSITDIINIEDSPEKNQDSLLRTEDNVHIQDSDPRRNNNNNDQLFHQTEQSPLTLNSVEEFLMFGEDQTYSAEHFSNIQKYWSESESTIQEMLNENQGFQTEQSQPLNSTEERINTQDLPVKVWSCNQVLETEQSQPLKSTEERINSRDLPVKVWSCNQVLETEQSQPLKSIEERINSRDLPVKVWSCNVVIETKKPPPSNSMKEVINIPESPEKVRNSKKPPQRLRVMMLPYSGENSAERKFTVDVNASENVEELRKQLEKIQQRSQLILPQEGYFFIHKRRVLDEDESFRWNGVVNGDTIEIFPGHVTHEGPKETRVRKHGQ